MAVRRHHVGPSVTHDVILAPSSLRKRLVAQTAQRRFFNFEVLGLDFADAEQDGIPGELVSRQTDLRVPIAEKLARLEKILDDLAARWDLVTLGQVAADVQLSE